MKDQRTAKLRICAHCEKVFWDHPTLYGCPVCDFAHYGAIWILGWKKAIWAWLKGTHKVEKDQN